MKKTAYLAPEMKTLELDMEQMIAYSGGSTPDPTTNEPPVVVDPNPDPDPDPNRSRGFGW